MTVLGNLTHSIAESSLCPDAVIRSGIRYLLRKRLQEIYYGNEEMRAKRKTAFVDGMGLSAVALNTDQANAQHYEVPSTFFKKILGPHLKYSSAFWSSGIKTLADAERESLRKTCAHADLHDGQRVLELGCGWGGLTLWIAEHYPQSKITAVSNSHSQRAYIEAQARERGLSNLHVLTCDMNQFDIAPGLFDRVVSVEMFEHMRNWQHLFGRVHHWLKAGGRFFMHIFVHRDVPYVFEVRDASDWMSQHFFTGGMMPSDDLPLRVRGPFKLVHQWRWDGTHYEKTANAWLDQMDACRETLWPILEGTYGVDLAATWWMRWRVFFMACSELFGYQQGQEWWVSHYLFEKPKETTEDLS